MPVLSEADITINGRALTPGQSMTVRVALQIFSMSLNDVRADDLGLGMHSGYRAAIREINEMIGQTPAEGRVP